MSKQITLEQIEKEYDRQIDIFCSSGGLIPQYSYSERRLKIVLKHFYKALYLPITMEGTYMWITHEKDLVSRPLLNIK